MIKNFPNRKDSFLISRKLKPVVIVLEDIYVDVTDLKISSSKERKHWSTDSFEMKRRFKLKSEALTQNQ